jgi:hypothetical protein
LGDLVKITITVLPSKHWHARGTGRSDIAEWPQDQPLKDEHFFRGSSIQFRHELRRKLRFLQRQGGKVKAA